MPSRDGTRRAKLAGSPRAARLGAGSAPRLRLHSAIAEVGFSADRLADGSAGGRARTAWRAPVGRRAEGRAGSRGTDHETGAPRGAVVGVGAGRSRLAGPSWRADHARLVDVAGLPRWTSGLLEGKARRGRLTEGKTGQARDHQGATFAAGTGVGGSAGGTDAMAGRRSASREAGEATVAVVGRHRSGTRLSRAGIARGLRTLTVAPQGQRAVALLERRALLAAAAARVREGIADAVGHFEGRTVLSAALVAGAGIRLGFGIARASVPPCAVIANRGLGACRGA